MANRTAVALLLALATATGLAAQSTSTTTDPVEGKQIQGSLNVTGTVISSDDNRLIVKADNGQQMTFIVNEQTTDPKLFNVGDRVTASYVTLAGTGPVVTKVISVPAETKTTSTGTVIYPPAAEAPAVSATAKVTTPPAPSASATVTTPAPVATTTVAEVDSDMDADDDETALPATASPLPLIALAGFAAGAAARVTRRLRKK
jgi:hypothetical protein